MTESIISSGKYDFLDKTHRLNDYNEISNVNKYIFDATKADFERISSINENLKKRVLKLKQEYMLYEHGAHMYRFRSRLLYFTSVCICLILFFITMGSDGRLGPVLTIIISSSILLFTLIVVIFVVIANNSRRNNSYNQYYWQEAKDVKNKS